MTYPQIYSSNVKLQINVDKIVVKPEHFERFKCSFCLFCLFSYFLFVLFRALKVVSPSCARSTTAVAALPLQNEAQRILLAQQLRQIISIIEQDLFPAVVAQQQQNNSFLMVSF